MTTSLFMKGVNIMSAIEEALKAVKDVGGSALKKVGNVDAWGQVGNKLHSNKAINNIEETKGIAGTILRMMDNGEAGGMNFNNALKNAYSKDGMGNGVDYGAIAGSYIGASAGYRALSGGGAYRDKNGNANIVGIPFV